MSGWVPFLRTDSQTNERPAKWHRISPSLPGFAEESLVPCHGLIWEFHRPQACALALDFPNSPRRAPCGPFLTFRRDRARRWTRSPWQNRGAGVARWCRKRSLPECFLPRRKLMLFQALASYVSRSVERPTRISAAQLRLPMWQTLAAPSPDPERWARPRQECERYAGQTRDPFGSFADTHRRAVPLVTRGT